MRCRTTLEIIIRPHASVSDNGSSIENCQIKGELRLEPNPSRPRRQVITCLPLSDKLDLITAITTDLTQFVLEGPIPRGNHLSRSVTCNTNLSVYALTC